MSVVCVRVGIDAVAREVRIRHDDAHVEMGGALTIVGAVREHGFVMVARETPDDDAKLSILSHIDDDCVDRTARGDILVTRTDRRGKPVDVDVDTWTAWLEQVV